MKELPQLLLRVEQKQIDEIVQRVTENVLAALTEKARPQNDTWDTFAACEALRISKTTLHRLRKAGLPTHKVGDAPRFIPAEVMAWLAKRGGDS